MKRAIMNVTRVLFLLLFLFLLVVGKTNLWLIIFGTFLLLTPLLGRVYCGWICPMNTAMIPAEWVAKKLNIQVKDTPNWKILKATPWIMLGLLILSMIFLKRGLGLDLPILLYLAIFAAIITLKFKPSLFHNALCPFGALLGLAGKLSFFSYRVNEEKCVGCKKCEKVCPSNSIVVDSSTRKATINQSLCHQCSNCEVACPTDAIGYGRR